MDKKANNLVLGANLLFTTVMCICELGKYMHQGTNFVQKEFLTSMEFSEVGL